MARGLRCKRACRLRSVKRQHIQEGLEAERKQNSYDALMKLKQGIPYGKPKVPNAFLDPEAPGAQFPQHVPQKHADFRSENLPLAGFVTVGNRRKFLPQEKEALLQYAKQGSSSTS